MPDDKNLKPDVKKLQKNALYATIGGIFMIILTLAAGLLFIIGVKS